MAGFFARLFSRIFGPPETDQETIAKELDAIRSKKGLSRAQREHEERVLLEKKVREGKDPVFKESKQNTFQDFAQYESWIKTIVSHIKVEFLVIGMSGSGKSSFIESLKILSEGVITRYLTKGNSGHMNTILMEPIIFNKESEKLHNITIWDIAGLQEVNDGTAFVINSEESLKHIKDIVTGGIIEGQYNCEGLPTRTYKKTEALKNCVVIVCRAKEVEVRYTKNFVKEGWTKILVLIKELGFYPVVVLTGCDEISENVKKDPRLMYRSYIVSKAIEDAAKFFGVNESNVCPVINYTNQRVIEESLHLPLVAAVNTILNSAGCFLEKTTNAKNLKAFRDEQESASK